MADGWTSAGDPEQEMTSWDTDREKAHVQELGSVWTWLPAEGTQTSEQGRGTSWERKNSVWGWNTAASLSLIDYLLTGEYRETWE